MPISMKAEKIWSKHLNFLDAFHNEIIKQLTKVAEEIYDELKEKSCSEVLLKVTKKDAFIKALTGDFLIGLLDKYKAAHPDFGGGVIEIDDRRLYEIGALDHTIISWVPESTDPKH